MISPLWLKSWLGGCGGGGVAEGHRFEAGLWRGALQSGADDAGAEARSTGIGAAALREGTCAGCGERRGGGTPVEGVAHA